MTDKKWLDLDKNRLAVSVFAGDNDAPLTKKLFNLWKKLGAPEKESPSCRKNNWWGRRATPGCAVGYGNVLLDGRRG